MKRKFYEKWKKLCAVILSAGMLVTSCPADVFAAVGDADNGCLKVFNRGGEDGGAAFNLNNQMSMGKTYTVSAKIMYTSGAAQRKINITIEAGPNYRHRKIVASATVAKGEWTEIKSTNYQPCTGDNGGEFDATNVKLFFETPFQSKDLDDFYIDDVVVTENDGASILNESFDDDTAIDPSGATVTKVSKFANAEVEWVTEGGEIPPDPSEIVPLEVNGNAETGNTDGWAVISGGDENATLTATTEDKYEGQYSIKVTNRRNCASGPMQDMSSKLEKGRKYKVVGRVKYTTGPNNRNFEVCYQYGDTYQERTTLKTFSVKKGKWTQLYGTFTAKGTGTDKVFISTTYVQNATPENDLMDFYVDNVVISLDDGEVPATQEHDCIEGSTLVSGALKAENNNTNVNPLFDYKFGADPFAITYDGRVYVYTTNDSQEYETVKDKYGYPTKDNGFGNINTLNVFSSDDMVNWTDHGEISVAGKGFASLSWAPAACHKKIDGKDKFFLYFANGGNGIGVLESDSPIGPFEAPNTEKGSALITRNDPQSAGVEWLFDPAVLVDDDGTGYLYYGGGVPAGKDNAPQTIRVVKLKDNMVEVDGDAVMIDAPGAFEDSGIHKYNGKYYYTYCSNFTNNLTETGTGNICAMVSDDPMTGFEFAGIVFKNQANYFGAGNGGNNHHCFFEFNGKNYLTYHSQTLAVELGFGTNQGGYRSTHIDEFEYDENGKMNVIGTWNGRKQVHNLNPYKRVEAETFAWSKGIKTDVCEEDGSLVEGLNMKVTEITDGDYLAVSNADFGKEGKGATKFTMHVLPQAAATVELHLDGTAGEKVGEVKVATSDDGTPSWTDVSCDVSVTGKHSLYLVFKGAAGKQLMEADYWKFDSSLAADKQSKVNDVIDLINKIGKVSGDQASETAINNASEAFGALTTEEKEYVTNAAALTAAKSDNEAKKTENVNKVITLINKIGKVSGDPECGNAIKAAREAFDALMPELQQRVTNSATLEEAETAYNKIIEDQAKVDAVIDLIEQIGTVSGDEASETAINNAREAFDALTPELQQKVTNAATLTTAEKTYKDIKDKAEKDKKDKAEADAVITLINKIGTVTGDQASQAAIEAARAAYDKLTAEQKKLVTNFSTLTAAEKTYKDIKDKENGAGTGTGTGDKDNGAVKKGDVYSSGNYQYKVLNVSKKTVAVTKALKSSKTIKVPNTVKIKGTSYKVTEVAKGAFKNDKKVKSVTIGKNVTSIGVDAFSGAKNLAKIKFSGTAVKKIGKNAFKSIKKNATFSIKKSKRASLKKLLKKAKTKNFKVK